MIPVLPIATFPKTSPFTLRDRCHSGNRQPHSSTQQDGIFTVPPAHIVQPIAVSCMRRGPEIRSRSRKSGGCKGNKMHPEFCCEGYPGGGYGYCGWVQR